MSAMRRACWLAIAAAARAWAAPEEPSRADPGSPSGEVRRCAEWFAALDAQVEADGARDAQYERVPGFPYLRADRISAPLAEGALRNEAATQRFAERLLGLDLEARGHEIANLSRERFEALPGAATLGRSGALQITRACGRLLRELDLARPGARERLVAGVRLARPAGRPAGALRAPALPAPQETVLVRYAPPAAVALERGAVAAILDSARLDPLGIPEVPERDFERFAAAYAPSFEVAVADDRDRFGALRWRPACATPQVDASDPAVYVQPDYARYGGRVLLQLRYAIWFPSPETQAGCADAGAHDALIWRVTLAPDGEPLVYDSIEPRSGGRRFFPTPRARVAPDPFGKGAFAPQPLPRLAEGERPLLRIAPGTHAIERVTLVRGADSLARYALRPYALLRSMPRPEGGSRSAVPGARPDAEPVEARVELELDGGRR